MIFPCFKSRELPLQQLTRFSWLHHDQHILPCREVFHSVKNRFPRTHLTPSPSRVRSCLCPPSSSERDSVWTWTLNGNKQHSWMKSDFTPLPGSNKATENGQVTLRLGCTVNVSLLRCCTHPHPRQTWPSSAADIQVEVLKHCTSLDTHRNIRQFLLSAGDTVAHELLQMRLSLDLTQILL